MLGRVCAALDCFEVETHVEVHGDGPLADWRVIDRAVAIYAGGQHHLVTNADPVTYPPGLEVWVYAADLARRLAREQHAAQYRESPVLYVMQHPDDFAVGRFEAPPALRAPELYLEVDEAADFAVLSTIIERLYPVNPAFTTEDVLALVASEPALAESNRAVFRRWKAPPPSL